METRANHALVGAFTLLVLAAAFAFVWWFAGEGKNRERAIYRVQFQGAVSGLTPGSGVLFNGIRVGDVTNLNFDPQDPARVVARIEVFKNTPIRTDTRARLEMTGLTGGAVIQLTGGSQTAQSFPLVTTEQGDPNNAPVLVAESSAFQDILEGARTVLQQAQTTFGDIQGLVGNSRGSIERSLQNVEQFTAALSANSDDLKTFLQSTGVAARQIGVLADNLVPLVTDVQNLVRAVDVNKVDKTMTNAVAFSESLKNAGPQVEKAIEQVAGLAEQLRGSGVRVDDLLRNVQEVVAAVDPAKVNASVQRFTEVLQSIDPAKVSSTLDSIDKATRNADRVIAAVDPDKINRAVDGFSGLMTSIDGPTINRTVASLDRAISAIDGEKVRATVDNVSRFAEALGRNAANVDQIVADARDVSGRLTGTADKLDGLLDDARKLVGSGEAQGAIADFQKTSQAIRELAIKLDGRTAEIAAGVSRLSSSGSRDLQGFVSDSRRTLNNLDGVINDLKRNPRQFLFGGNGGVPEYRGR
ncbi:MlaD family protein [Hansschlegelia sp. KR7-227]|jgi:phospholipid/cholesterol/gamma-HCH transport system substrate-binding protein|uniref:MlaD family protein n=1 Tax=Hansschlegelia sp. KR7-227 TaxID=3400914 RepID=UPI003C0CC809